MALARLKSKGEEFERDIHLTFVPDEEDGEGGMKQLVDSDTFKKLNIGLTLDEGFTNGLLLLSSLSFPIHTFFLE